MSNTNITLLLTSVANPNIKQSASVFGSGNIWTTPVGGWMSGQKGVWNQLPDGLHLMDSQNKKHIAICQGCNFLLSGKDTSGKAIFPESGDSGGWTVIAVTP